MFRVARLLATVTLLAASAAQADIKRGCNGTISMNSYPTGVVVLADMDASGFCRNRARANDCRRAARRKLDDCARSLWDSRWTYQIPRACTTPPSNPRSGMNYFRWTQILVDLPNGADSLKDRVEYNVCCQPNPQFNTFQAAIFYTTNGQKGCAQFEGVLGSSNREDLTTEYTVRCRELRRQGLCPTGRRTSGD